ncbi:transposase [Paenibacillus sp. GCM10012306]|uniref:transposase n=1 Tax=Paenibacillus sp. GCM10012306 TaxID=3317342 RepID=UPI00361C578C
MRFAYLLFTAGNINDCTVVIEVLSGVTLSESAVLADKAYGTLDVRDRISA